MTAYAQIVDINATSLSDTVNGALVSHVYAESVDINATSFSEIVYALLYTGAHVGVVDINAVSLCGVVTGELLIGAHDVIVNIDSISLCADIAGDGVVGNHGKIVNIDSKSYCRPIPGTLMSAGLYIAFDMRQDNSKAFIRSPLMPVLVSGVARPRVCATEFRAYLFAASYEGRVIEHLTIRWNLDDKRFVRGIYASKAPTE